MSGKFPTGRSILIAAALASGCASGSAAKPAIAVTAGATRSVVEQTAVEPAAVADALPATRLAAVICGGNGCAPVQTKSQPKRKFQPLGHG